MPRREVAENEEDERLLDLHAGSNSSSGNDTQVKATTAAAAAAASGKRTPAKAARKPVDLRYEQQQQPWECVRVDQQQQAAAATL